MILLRSSLFLVCSIFFLQAVKPTLVEDDNVRSGNLRGLEQTGGKCNVCVSAFWLQQTPFSSVRVISHLICNAFHSPSSYCTNGGDYIKFHHHMHHFHGIRIISCRKWTRSFKYGLVMYVMV